MSFFDEPPRTSGHVGIAVDPTNAFFENPGPSTQQFYGGGFPPVSSVQTGNAGMHLRQNNFVQGTASNNGVAPFGEMGSVAGNVALQYGAGIAGNAVNQGKSFISRIISIDELRYYFAVNQSYVVNKIILLNFPFKHKCWDRSRGQSCVNSFDGGDSGAGMNFLPPAEDLNAPDLYIPTMAFVTYVLMAAFYLGTAGRFTPQVLGATSSAALVLSFLEVGVFKAGFYFLGGGSGPSAVSVKTFDLMALCGYKYLAVAINMLCYIFLGNLYGYWPSLIYTSVATAWFMMKSLGCLTPEIVSLSDNTGILKQFQVAVSLAQPLLLWFLGWH